LQKCSQQLQEIGYVTKVAIVIHSRWRWPLFQIQFIAHSLLVIAYICTKFGMWTYFLVLPTNWL